jgi:CheY-like chemotaxis protein
MVAGTVPSAEGTTTSHEGAGITERTTSPPRPAPARPESPHVLVIDDNASVRSALVAYLRLGGHTVTEAERGDAGVRAFASTTVDLVVTDLDMPGLTGWEVARAVRTRRPTVPVVLITGNADAAEAEPSLRALVDAILLKPFGPRALLEVIRGLTMPGRSEEVPEPTDPGAGLSDPGAASRQLSVLLVEDNPGDARLIRELLRDSSALRVVSVETLAAALTQLADPHMDLVLLDLGLPDSQGVDTVSRVVHEHPALPVIVVTGHQEAALAQATAIAGAADYLVKGAMEPAQLLRAIQAACARKRSPGEGHAPS